MQRTDASEMEQESPANRALVIYAPQQRQPAGPAVKANACFLASLIASRLNAETVRSRRRADPATAAACYRAAQARSAA
ncbi:MAG: hypothetical protein ACRCXM_00920 [Beijerinckiaceae bacterium]